MWQEYNRTSITNITKYNTGKTVREDGNINSHDQELKQANRPKVYEDNEYNVRTEDRRGNREGRNTEIKKRRRENKGGMEKTKKAGNEQEGYWRKKEETRQKNERCREKRGHVRN